MGEHEDSRGDAVRRTLEQAAGEAYPRRLAAREAALIARRREAAGVEREQPVAGLALSGGGLRSATFCLGVLQALARLDLLRRVDVLSTVSGGGYIGAFLTALHLRDGVTPDTVRDVLASRSEVEDVAACTPGTLGGRQVLGWLRENGRHLAPNGSGDLFTGLAVMFRNWVSIQAVMLLMLLTLFTWMQTLRAFAEWHYAGAGGLAALQGLLQDWLPLGHSLLWWSPFAVIPVAVLVFLAVPFGWAYWLVALPRRTPEEIAAPWLAVLLVLLAVMVLAVSGFIGRTTAGVLLAVCVLTLLIAISARLLRNGSQRRRLLSEWLRNMLVAAVVTAAIALVDSVGQSAYLFNTLPGRGLSHWLGDAAAAVGAALAAGAMVARRLTVLMGGTSDTARPSLPKSLLAAAGAFAIFGIVFTAANAVSHAVAWGLQVPVSAPAELTDRAQAAGEALAGCPVVCPLAGAPAGCECLLRGQAQPWPLLWWATFLLLLSFVVSWSWTFLNRSTLLPLYTARLVRAYLGASNVNRVCPTGEDGSAAPPVTVTRVLPDDDPTLDEWRRRAGWALDAAPEKGAPLHLVNVTVNETVSGRSQVQQNDRRGVGMAVGPAGLSAGREHHAVLEPVDGDGVLHAQVFPADRGDGSRPFRMFEFPAARRHSYLERVRDRAVTVMTRMRRRGGDASEDGPVHAPARKRSQAAPARAERGGDLREMTAELMSLSYWMGVSGAAFSTGLGYRTRLGLSLLAGFFNVRLGYWWDSGVEPARRGLAQLVRKSLCGRVFTRLFPVQSLLIDEFVARFHGPSRQWWYLSDGGHFENMGAYELIRRRLPLIIIVDAEADPDYRFEGLANLVRKARIDFGAEVRFLEVPEIDRYAANAAAGMTVTRRVLGTLDMLRRCSWDTATIAGDAGTTALKRSTPGASDRESLSLAHAAVGIVTWPDSDQVSRIIHLKPTLTGTEPADLLHYHATEPDFPQQTTADQFFDEAQWESYRRLGEHIALEVFHDGLDPCPIPRER